MSTKQKVHNVRAVSSLLFGDFLRPTAQETAPQIALRNFSEEIGGVGQYICDFDEGGVLTIKHSSLQKFPLVWRS